MTSMMGMGIGFLIVLGWGGLMIWASVLAFRGKRYWATWLMLIGASMQLIGGAVYVGAMSFMFTSLSSGGSGSSASSLASGVGLVIGMFALIPLGVLLFGAGTLGVCSRFGAIEKRAADLETLNLQLQERLQE